jgi:large subunit ribosomal protein L21e
VCGQVGDYVDIKVDAGVQKGMPHKFYHGRTGIVFNVTNSSVGVVVNKVIGGRIEKKRVNIRVEHVKPSKCRVDFLARVASNERVKAASRVEGGVRKELKRSAGVPRPGAIIKGTKVNAEGAKEANSKFLHPQPYEFIC